MGKILPFGKARAKRRPQLDEAPGGSKLERARASIEADDLRPEGGGFRRYVDARIRRAVDAELIVMSPSGARAETLLRRLSTDQLLTVSPVLRSEATDLKVILRDPQAQRTALVALGAIKADEMVAVDLMAVPHHEELALVLGGCPLPGPAMQLVAPLWDRLVRQDPDYAAYRADVAPAWYLVLVGLFASELGERLSDSNAPTVDEILNRVRESVRGERMLPTMRDPTQEQRDEAARVLKAVRVAQGRPGGRPSGRLSETVPVSAWSAAKRFAEAFGFTAPARESDAKDRGKRNT